MSKSYITTESDKIKVIAAIAKLKLTNKKGKPISYTVEIVRKRDLRNIQQNKLYWAFLKVLSDELGISSKYQEPVYLHAYYKQQYLSELIEMNIGGEKKTIVVIRSTTTLNTKEFAEYYDNCVKHARDFHGFIWDMELDDERLKDMPF